MPDLQQYSMYGSTYTYNVVPNIPINTTHLGNLPQQRYGISCTNGRLSNGHDTLVLAGGFNGFSFGLETTVDILDLVSNTWLPERPALPNKLYEGSMVNTCAFHKTGPCRYCTPTALSVLSIQSQCSHCFHSVLYVGGISNAYVSFPANQNFERDVYELNQSLDGWTKREDLQLAEKAAYFSAVTYWRP